MIRSTTSDFTNASDAQFRTWGKWLRDCFSAAGWTLEVETFGTGTDWTDVTAPNAANQTRVTVIFQMADALAATAPLFAKIEIGSGSAAGNPGIRLTLGTGRSGSTITGTLIDTGATYLSMTATTQIMNHYASGDTDRILISMTHSGPSWSQAQQFVLSIERRKNASGVNQATGFLLAYLGSNTATSRGFLASAAGPTARNAWYALMWSTTINFDSKSPTPPIVYDMGVLEMGMNLLGVVTANYPLNHILTPTIFGSAHSYLVSQITVTGVDGASGNNKAAFRYE